MNYVTLKDQENEHFLLLIRNQNHQKEQEEKVKKEEIIKLKCILKMIDVNYQY